MKKMLLGLVAVFALGSVAPAFAEEGAAGDKAATEKPAKGKKAKKGKKAEKKPAESDGAAK